jgi:hypothetical protein
MTLIERLKTGPGSRELSDEVLLACGYTYRKREHWQVSDYWYHPNSETIVIDPPNPTLNTDNALDLVPDGWAITHTYWDRKRAACNLMNEGRKYACGPEAPTLPLAICAAVLRIEK